MITPVHYLLRHLTTGTEAGLVTWEHDGTLWGDGTVNRYKGQWHNAETGGFALGLRRSEPEACAVRGIYAVIGVADRDGRRWEFGVPNSPADSEELDPVIVGYMALEFSLVEQTMAAAHAGSLSAALATSPPDPAHTELTAAFTAFLAEQPDIPA